MTSLSLKAYQSSCRCCLQHIDNEKNSLKMTDETFTKYKEILNVLDDLDNNLPIRSICQRCYKYISEYSEFRKMLVETHHKLVDLIKNDPQSDSEKIIPNIVGTEVGEAPHNAQHSKTSIETPTIPQLPRAKENFCNICNKFFTEKRKVKLHIQRVHQRIKDFSCEKCEYTAFKKYDVLLHLRSIHFSKQETKKSSICPVCGLIYVSNSKLNVHIKRKHTSDLKDKWSCDICPYKAAILNELKKHMLTHLPKELKESFPCKQCPSILSSKGSLKVHMNSKHSNLRPFSCFCGKSFTQKSVYQRHYSIIHKGEKKYKCSYCLKAFSGSNHLRYHIKAFHTTSTTAVTCEFCGKLYKSVDSLKIHRLYHMPPKFHCTICQKAFFENKKLMDHRCGSQKHEIKCTNIECTRNFRLQSQLKYHLKKVHFKEKLTFRCSHEGCSSTFSRKSTYRQHALKHVKELDTDAMKMFLEKIKNCIPEEHQE